MQGTLKTPRAFTRVSLGILFASLLFGNFSKADIANGLVAYWTFDQTLTDYTATGATGSLEGSGSVSYANAKFGDGVDLDGIDQRIEITGVPESTFDFADSDLTISAWFRIDAFDKNFQCIIAKGESNSWRVARQGGFNIIGYAGGTGDISGDLGSAPNITDGQFHHVVAITEEGVTTRIWVDGVLRDTSTDAPSIGDASDANLMIGGNPGAFEDNFRTWNGVIDDVAIWNRVLTPTEITEIWNDGTGASLDSLIVPDSDSDGLPDDWEIANGLNPNDDAGDNGATGNPDNDGLTNVEEFNLGTHPNMADSDADGLNDGAEVNTHQTDPKDSDTDDDGLSDGDEVNIHNSDPKDKDSDDDGLSDGEEVTITGTFPDLSDSDEDGAGDGLEVLLDTDPNLTASVPPTGSALSGVTSPGTVGPFLDNALPVITPNANTGVSWTTVNAFPNIVFNELKAVMPEPDPDPSDNEEYVVAIERQGCVQRVDWVNRETTTVKTEILAIENLVEYGDNGGLRSFVYHPNFNVPGAVGEHSVFVFYSTSSTIARGFSDNSGQFFYRLSRFERDPNTGLIPASSEQVMIQQAALDNSQHIGGGLTFGLDGFLYISWGDLEEFQNVTPFYQDAQRIDRMFQCALICIDVDQQGGSVSSTPTRTLQGDTGPNAMAGTTQSLPSSHPYYDEDNFSGVGYNIPLTNYWHASNNVPPAGTGATSSDGITYPAHGPALEEHVAIGFRNPWRIWTDPVSGDIAIASVGSNTPPQYEEVEIYVPGGNYGWPYREGYQSETIETSRPKPPGGDSYATVYLGTEVDPVAGYDEEVGRAITGGVTYQGTQWSTLIDQVIYGDNNTGLIFSADYKLNGNGVAAPTTELVDSTLDIRFFATSPDGEDILVAGYGEIAMLVDNSGLSPEPPSTLSATGAFTDLANLTPRAGVIPYEPVAPLWSDRAAKFRFLAIPNDLGVPGEYDVPGEKIIFSEEGEWEFPVGTVFIKHFAIPLDEADPGNPSLRYHVETRFLVLGQNDVWYSFTYAWRPDQTEADLVPDGDTSVFSQTLTIFDEDDSTYLQTWTYPTRNECFDCHQTAAGSVLGVKTRQLNFAIPYPSGALANQLTTLSTLEMFDESLSIIELTNYLTSAYITDETETLEHRVRSYLDSNCAHCHRPGASSGRAVFDVLMTTPLLSTGLIDGDPKAGDHGLVDPSILKPGDPFNSMLWHRDRSLDPEIRMPPIARSLEDEDYLGVLTRWISRLGYPNFDAHATANDIIGGIHEDEDGDGLSNGLEFLLGLNGFVPGHDAGMAIDSSGPETKVSVPLVGDALADGLGPLLLDSADLLNWYEAGSPNSILTPFSDTSAPGVDGVMTWQFLPGGKGFVKIGLQAE